MKLFVFAALVAAASAGRLEHLERSYLPPDHNVQNGNGVASGNGHFGASAHSSNGFGPNGVSNGFGSHGRSSFGIGSNGHSAPLGSNGFGASHGSNSNGFSRNSAFEGATSNQYLPPDHGPSGSLSHGVPQLGARSGSGSFGSNRFGSLSGSQGFGSRSQFGAASRQYLAPKYTPSQNAPQQPFDDNSGYIY